ncbi:autophagy-related protein 2 homolog B isoform X2 [Sardina pilchardus]|uniref:autophagy-related protein 2 homolog B isoform X2 n=1 Tax=Sardina pilchardus TaxID=27697 RepID=UPI002E126DBD
MPWPFSESIKKRACRYLLHRYLGNFLQEKLSLDQLSLDLYQGTGSLTQVPLDKWSLNELLESCEAPLEVTEGFIQSIVLTVPWAALLQHSCTLEVRGLRLVLRPRPRAASGLEPMCWSSFMTSSMQLARECLSQRLTDEQAESGPLEGLETFAETIDTVLRRIKVAFLDAVLRIEHIPPNSKTGIALELRIARMEYCDELAGESSGGNLHQTTSFAHKSLRMQGISVYWDEFTHTHTHDSELKLSPSWSPHIVCEPITSHPQFSEPITSHPQFSGAAPSAQPLPPLQVGTLGGTVTLSLTLKQNNSAPGAKLEVDGQMESLVLLLSPRQVHLLLDMWGGFSPSGGPEWAGPKDRKCRPMQQEDEYRLHMELSRCLKKETMATPAEQDLFESQTTRTVSSREEVFFSMAEMDMSHSLSSLPPLGDPPTVDLDLSLNSNYSASLAESPSGQTAAGWDEYLEVNRQRDKQQEATYTHTHKLHRQTSDDSSPEVLLRLAVERLLVVVLHIDPLPPADSAHSPSTPMASHFFQTLANHNLLPNGSAQSRDVLDKACPHDHLRLVAEGVCVSYEHTQSSSVMRLNSDVSFDHMELLECLVSMEMPNNTHTAQYTELLTFDATDSSTSAPPCLHLLYKLTERRGPQGGQVRALPGRADVQVELCGCRVELDISIVDRLHSLLQPRKHVTMDMMTSHMYTSYNKPVSLHKAFAEVFLDDSRSPAQCDVSVSVCAPRLVVCLRFPIPDLRCDAERGPWFRRRLQKEQLELEIKEPELKSHFTGGTHAEQNTVELSYRELIGSLHGDKEEESVQFLRVSHSLDDISTSDSGKFDWPRVVLKVNPMAVHSLLERVAVEEEEEEEEPGVGLQEEEASHSLKDVCDFSQPEPSPFSSRRVMYENEEMVIPGDVLEMTEFQEKTTANSRFILELSIPNLQITLPSKAFYETLHNRINNDLLLWEPTAPSPVETVESMPYGVGLSVASQLINTHLKDFSPEEEDSGSEEDSLAFAEALEVGSRRRKRRMKSQSRSCQSLFSVLLNVHQGALSLHTQRERVCEEGVCEEGVCEEGVCGEVWVELQGAVLFGVAQYEGSEEQHYLCFHTTAFSLYHQGLVERDCGPVEVTLPSRPRPHWLEPTLYASETAAPLAASEPSPAPSEGLGVEPHSMLSAAVKVLTHTPERNMKEYLVAVGMRGVTLQHRVVANGQGWYDQIVDFLNVKDEAVLGYTPPTSISTLHLHLWSCALDYRPLYLPVRSLVTVETFSISSSLALDHSSSTIRIILDEAALFLSDKTNVLPVNLSRDYVQVVDMGTLELRITAAKRATAAEQSEPRFELRCSSDVIHIRTCYDSCAALMNLIQYVASYGDLLPPSGPEASSSTQPKAKSEAPGAHLSQSPLLPEAEQQILQELMSDAMEEDEQSQTHTQPNGFHDDLRQETDPPRSDLFLFPDESGNLPEASPPFPTPLHSPLISPPVPPPTHDTDDFCILDTPTSRAAERDEEPVVRILTAEAIVVKENHFSGVASRAALFPTPDVRYLLKEISLVWHLYGGRDFSSAPAGSSPSRSRGCSPSQTPVRQARGGRVGGGLGRNPDVLMEIQLSKVRFQHEVYPSPPGGGEGVERLLSRQVFVVQELEVRDRLASSQINKFLYLFSSKELPRKAHANMLTVRAVHMSVEADDSPQECCLRVSLMPLRLNIDQDALFFLRDFFCSLAAEVELFSPPEQEALCVSMKRPAGSDVSCSFSKQDPAPIISMPTQASANQNGLSEPSGQDPEREPASLVFTDQPIFFREFRFTSDVPIRLDYHGKHLAIEQGTFAGIVMGLAQLSCSELTLRRLCYRQGLLGVDRLFSYAINEWLSDIKKNQLPGLLGGVGPIHSLLQLVQGCRDLLWLPIQQYRKDGRIVRGVQRGTASFGTSTAMATLELTNRMVRTIQAAAETAYDMVSPGTNGAEDRRLKRYSHHRLAHQPVDLREGVAKAYSVVKEGLTDTALGIIVTATREHEQRGVTGAVGGVLRQLPPAMVKPLIVATEATSNVLGGMRNQIQPDARQEETQKWRLGEE